MVKRQLRHIGPVGFIVLLHVAFLYALQSGLLRQEVQAVPQEVFATFITPETPASEPAKPQPVVPKTVPLVRKAPVPQPTAPAPVEAPPSQQAISIAPRPAVPVAVTEPAPAIPAPPKTVSGVEYIQAPQADYPLISRKMREEGRVILRVLVNEKGLPEKVEIQKSSGSERLDEAGRRAVMRALFKPHVEDGKALSVYTTVPIKFELNN